MPGILLLCAAAIAGSVMQSAAGRGTDEVSVMAQQIEVRRALGNGMDQLSFGQESIGICEECIERASSSQPDRTWLHEHVGERLFNLYDAHETYVLDGANSPVYAARNGQREKAETFLEVQPAVLPVGERHSPAPQWS